jgi:hypothetical protein
MFVYEGISMPADRYMSRQTRVNVAICEFRKRNDSKE